jgi:hypothetical protein
LLHAAESEYLLQPYRVLSRNWQDVLDANGQEVFSDIESDSNLSDHMRIVGGSAGRNDSTSSRVEPDNHTEHQFNGHRPKPSIQRAYQVIACISAPVFSSNVLMH